MKQTSYERKAAYDNKSAPDAGGGRADAQALAELVHVSARTIISIEKGQYSPSLMLAYRMARVFGTTVEQLCCLEENMQREEEQYEGL